MRALIALVLMTSLAGCHVEADFSDAIDAEGLIAEEYQQEIRAIDRLLFSEQPLGASGVAALEKEIGALAARVKAARDSKFIKVESLELELLAKRAGRLSPDRNGAALQNDWMRIRNNLFDDRAWFVRSAADLEYAATVVKPTAPAPSEPMAVEKAPPAVAVEVDGPRTTLTGEWQVRSILMNGRPGSDAELMDSVWMFDEPRIVVTDRNGKTTIFEYLRSGDSLQVSSRSEGSGSILYAINGQALRLAFHDGFAKKPESFTGDPAQPDPVHVALRLVPVRRAP